MTRSSLDPANHLAVYPARTARTAHCRCENPCCGERPSVADAAPKPFSSGRQLSMRPWDDHALRWIPGNLKHIDQGLRENPEATRRVLDMLCSP